MSRSVKQDYETIRAQQARAQEADRVNREGVWTMTETEFNRELAKAWDEGAEAGSANQRAWDGWRHSKGYPITNPYEPKP